MMATQGRSSSIAPLKGQTRLKVLKIGVWFSKIKVFKKKEGRRGFNLKVGIEICFLM